MIASGSLLLVLSLGVTVWVAQLSKDFHTALMAQIAQSGLARESASDYQSGWLKSQHAGRLQLAQSYCPGCDVLDYAGAVYHGIGTLLSGHAGLVSAAYTLQWPKLPVEPAVPPLQLQASQGLLDGLQTNLAARLTLPASQHSWQTPTHTYALNQGGLKGSIAPGALQLRNPQLQLHRDQNHWLSMQDLQLQAAAAEALMLDLRSAQLQLPLWSWQGEDFQLDYRQQGGSQALDLQLQLDLARGTLAGKPHTRAQADLQIDRLNLDDTLAFARELPRLLAPQTTGAARMLGLFSLYSVHGPGFFAAKPALRLRAEDVPLPQGLMQLQINLAVTAQTQRPPMHPLEWQRALQGRIDITAPAAHLAQGWRWAAQFISYITGLPTDYSRLKQLGWVKSLPDGRDRLLIVLDPLTGPRHETPAS